MFFIHCFCFIRATVLLCDGVFSAVWRSKDSPWAFPTLEKCKWEKHDTNQAILIGQVDGGNQYMMHCNIDPESISEKWEIFLEFYFT